MTILLQVNCTYMLATCILEADWNHDFPILLCREPMHLPFICWTTLDCCRWVNSIFWEHGKCLLLSMHSAADISFPISVSLSPFSFSLEERCHLGGTLLDNMNFWLQMYLRSTFTFCVIFTFFYEEEIIVIWNGTFDVQLLAIIDTVILSMTCMWLSSRVVMK
jgi:hypothetical protein